MADLVRGLGMLGFAMLCPTYRNILDDRIGLENMKIMMFVLIVTLGAANSYASEAHKVLAEEFLVLIDLEHTFSLDPVELTEVSNVDDLEAAGKVVDRLEPVIGWNKIKPKAIEIVMELYPASELLEINAMLKTPTGRKFLSKLRVLDDRIYHYYAPQLLQELNH